MVFDTDSPEERREASEYESLHRRQADAAQKRRELAERIFQAVRLAIPVRKYEHPRLRSAIERVLAEQDGK